MPASVNGRGLREVGCVAGLGPGLSEVPGGLARGAGARRGLPAGEVGAFYLLHIDPLRELPGREPWDAALRQASFVVAHQQFLGEAAIEQHADVVFPAESYAEKEGTVTHPDGRLQRLRPAIGHPGRGARRMAASSRTSRQRLGLDVRRSVTAGAVLAEIAEQRADVRGHHARRDRRPRRALAGTPAGANAARGHSATSASARRGAARSAEAAATARCGSRRGRVCGRRG